jgi:hypothetical protein
VKGFTDRSICTRVVETLIDRINVMLASLAKEPSFKGWVRYVDLRGTLPNAPKSYKTWWDNELHPTRAGFLEVAKKIRAAIP